MGWGSGSYIATDIIRAFETVSTNTLTPEAKVFFYTALIDALENCDWDTQDEAIGISNEFDKAMRKINPSMFEELDG